MHRIWSPNQKRLAKMLTMQLSVGWKHQTFHLCSWGKGLYCHYLMTGERK